MTLSTDDQLSVRSRQSELVDTDILSQPITLIGCGAIGSFTALTLAKMGFHNLCIYDHDEVSVENISNQFYRYEDIGRNKALSLAHMINDFEDIHIPMVYDRKWNVHDKLYDTVIMCVDSMTVRQLIFNNLGRGTTQFIDGRMGGQQAELYAFENVSYHKEAYAKYLWAEDEASELPCTQKAVMYNVLWIASNIANTLRLMLEGKPYHHVQNMDFENNIHNVIEVDV